MTVQKYIMKTPISPGYFPKHKVRPYQANRVLQRSLLLVGIVVFSGVLYTLALHSPRLHNFALYHNPIKSRLPKIHVEGRDVIRYHPLVHQHDILNFTKAFDGPNDKKFNNVKNSTNEFGYILVAHYSDQMTGASINVLSLQCWASYVSDRVRVVEPFIHQGSGFGVVLTTKKRQMSSNIVRLRDIMDINSWERQATKKGLSPLISWEDFLSQAPTNLILTSRTCPQSVDCIKCSRFHKSVAFFSRNDFKVVRRVCYENRAYSSAEFKKLIYGEFEPHQTVVVFNNWGGVISATSKVYRIQISDLRKCSRRAFTSFLFPNSPMIIQDGMRYTRKYIKGNREGYISVMFRLERFSLNHKFSEIMSDKDKMALLTDCIEGIDKRVTKLKAQYGMDGVFLAMDCREQGSRVFTSGSSPGYLKRDLVDAVALLLHRKLYGNSSSLDKWDRSFKEIATFQTPGYLAQLQKNLAINGRCLLTAGGGSFQHSALQLHKSSSCSFQIPECD